VDLLNTGLPFLSLAAVPSSMIAGARSRSITRKLRRIAVDRLAVEPCVGSDLSGRREMKQILPFSSAPCQAVQP